MAVGHAFLCSAMKILLILFLLRFAHNYVWNFEYVCHDNADDVYGPDCIAKRFMFCFVADGGSTSCQNGLCYALCTQRRKLRCISHMVIAVRSSCIRIFAENATIASANRLNKSIRCKPKGNNKSYNTRSKLGSHVFAKTLHNLKICIFRSSILINELERKQDGMANIYSWTGWTLVSGNRRSLMFILEYRDVIRCINFIKLKRRWSAKKMLYYNNSSTTYCLLLKSGDIEENPGPLIKKRATSRCSECEKAVAKNHKRCVCTQCFDFTYAKCARIFKDIRTVSATVPQEWTCHKCIGSLLPFYMDTLSDSEQERENSMDSAVENGAINRNAHLDALTQKAAQLKVMHINTQSMVSTFDNLLITLKDYRFDIVTMSETWLKDNNLLLQHVTIPGYSHAFRNRETRGGGVGIYIKESIKFKRRTDIESRYSQMEHLWIETKTARP